MRAIIIAAGKGTRLYPLTKNTPKSLIEIGNGITMLESQLHSLKENNIKDVTIIVGYRAEQIEAKIKKYQDDFNINTIFNPFFDCSNNLISVWMARHFMNEDFITINGDDIFKPTVIENLLKSESNITMVIDEKDKYDDDDMKVILDDSKSVVHVSKEVPLPDVMAESVGLVGVLGERYRSAFVKKVVSMLHSEEKLQFFWLRTFNELISDGLKVETIQIDSEDWAEVDFHPDIMTIRKEVFANLSEKIDNGD